MQKSSGLIEKEVKQGTRSKGVVVHGLHKSASMFLFHFFRQLASRRGWEFFSPNLNDGRVPDAQALPVSFCQCPVRSFDADDGLESTANISRIFHVRDPRDILVSEYYSIGFIHPVEVEKLAQRRQDVQKMTVDEYALNQTEFSEYPLEQKFEPLLKRMQFCGDDSTDVIVTYEMMVTDFYKWVSKVLPVFGGAFPRFEAAKLAWKYRNEFTPPASDTMTHKRRITPGDFRNKLSKETIEVLNDRFAPVLEAFGYQP